ncbi:MAG: hypothetical protein WC477_03835 [Patescibacteria group bacterium]
MTLREFILANGKLDENGAYIVSGQISKYWPAAGAGEVTLCVNDHLSAMAIDFHLADVWTANRFPRGPMTGDPVEVAFDLTQKDLNGHLVFYEVRRLRLPNSLVLAS